MTRKETSKFLWSRLLLTLLLGSLFTTLAIIIGFSRGSDGLEAKEGAVIFVLAGIALVFALTLCSLTVFFNLDAGIAQRKWPRRFAYFLMPVVATLGIAVASYSPDMFPGYLAVIVPFFIVHTYFYIQFSKRIANK